MIARFKRILLIKAKQDGKMEKQDGKMEKYLLGSMWSSSTHEIKGKIFYGGYNTNDPL